jgi:hypothetical protein
VYNLLVFSGLREFKSPSPHHILRDSDGLVWTLFGSRFWVLDLMAAPDCPSNVAPDQVPLKKTREFAQAGNTTISACTLQNPNASAGP